MQQMTIGRDTYIIFSTVREGKKHFVRACFTEVNTHGTHDTLDYKFVSAVEVTDPNKLGSWAILGTIVGSSLPDDVKSELHRAVVDYARTHGFEYDNDWMGDGDDD